MKVRELTKQDEGKRFRIINCEIKSLIGRTGLIKKVSLDKEGKVVGVKIKYDFVGKKSLHGFWSYDDEIEFI